MSQSIYNRMDKVLWQWEKLQQSTLRMDMGAYNGWL